MKKFLLFLSVLTCLSSFGKTWTVVSSGFTFSPATLTIQEGDSVLFTLAASHDAREVNQNTWNANGTAALSNGFQTPFGGGTVVPTKLTPGTHYYVCSNHASMGMKGTITVSPGAGILQQHITAQTLVFPNPAKGKVTIDLGTVPLSSAARLEVYNLKGELVGQSPMSSSSHDFDLSGLTAGQYLVKIYNDKAVEVKRIQVD